MRRAPKDQDTIVPNYRAPRSSYCDIPFTLFRRPSGVLLGRSAELDGLMLFDRKTIIPNLLGATLTLAGCGGDETPGPKSLMAAARDGFCMKMQTCEPNPNYDAFLMKYDDEICREGVDRLEFIAQHLSAECDAMMASYINCYATLPCDVLLRFNDYTFTSPEHDACVEELAKDPDFYACYLDYVRFFDF